MRSLIIAVLACIVVAACDGSRIANLGPGGAEVGGHVFALDGQAAAGVPISIGCAAGTISKSRTSDANGNFLANVSAPASVMDSTDGDILCEFQASDSLGNQADTTVKIQFFTGSIPQPLESVDLHLHP